MTEPPAIDLKDYRQPVVTSLGIVIGFLLGLMGQWLMDDDFAIRNTSDLVAFCGSLAGIVLLLGTLFRMLAPPAAGENVRLRYLSILRWYAAGIALPVVSIFLSAFL